MIKAASSLTISKIHCHVKKAAFSAADGRLKSVFEICNLSSVNGNHVKTAGLILIAWIFKKIMLRNPADQALLRGCHRLETIAIFWALPLLDFKKDKAAVFYRNEIDFIPVKTVVSFKNTESLL